MGKEIWQISFCQSALQIFIYNAICYSLRYLKSVSLKFPLRNLERNKFRKANISKFSSQKFLEKNNVCLNFLFQKSHLC